MVSGIGLPSASVMNMYAGMVAAIIGNVEDALAHHAEAVRLSDELGQPFLTAAAASSMVRFFAVGEIRDLWDLGIADADVDALQTRAEEAVAGPMGQMLSSIVHAELGFAAMATGDLDRAADQFRTGVEGTSATKYLAAPLLMVGLALTSIRSGDGERAQELLDEAASFVDAKGMAFVRPVVAIGTGALALSRAAFDDAIRVLADGAGLAETMEMAPAEWQLRATLAGALHASGRHTDATAEVERATAVIDAMGTRFVDRDLRDAFVSAAHGRLTDLAGVAGG